MSSGLLILLSMSNAEGGYECQCRISVVTGQVVRYPEQPSMSSWLPVSDNQSIWMP